MYFKCFQAFSHLLSHSNLEHHQESLEAVDNFLLDLFKMGVLAYFCLIQLYEETILCYSFIQQYLLSSYYLIGTKVASSFHLKLFFLFTM